MERGYREGLEYKVKDRHIGRNVTWGTGLRGKVVSLSFDDRNLKCSWDIR